MGVQWRLSCFGVPRLIADGRSLPLSRNDAGWLAYTAIHDGTASLHLATLIWPLAGERKALNHLRQRVHRLRQATDARLVEMGSTLVLAPDLSLEHPASEQALESDPAAWDAPLLTGLEFDAETEFASWLAAQRSAHAERRRDALARIASAAEDAGDLVRALRYAQRLLAEDALSEHAHRRLMRLHYLRRDTAAAVAAFEHCEALLNAELGLRPSAETLQLLRLVEQGRPPAAPSARAMPASLSRPPRLVGRDAALAQLRRAERDAQLAVVVGEAGMGKTRLLQELLGSRSDVVHAQARPGDAAVPYATLARLLRAVAASYGLQPGDAADLAPLFAVGTVAPTTAQRLADAVAAQLALAQARGLRLLAADDLHFADPASVELLLALTGAPVLGCLRWVLAHRPLASAAADAPLLAALQDMEPVGWVSLQPLDEAQLREFVSSLELDDLAAEPLATGLARHTGGNPLYVLETLRALVEAPQDAGVLPRPHSVGQLIDRRLARLSPAAMALARVAAIAVPDFSIELAEQALATPAWLLADAWRELEAAQVLRGEAFAHDLVHDAVLRSVPDAVARRAHREVAAYLSQRDAEPARVGAHWLAGGEGSRAGAALREAALRARASGREREAHELFEQAARGHAAAGETQAAWQARIDGIEPLLLSQGTAATLTAIDRLLAAEPPGRFLSGLWCARATALMFDGRAADAESAAQQALDCAPETDDDSKVGAARVLAQAGAALGKTARALAVLQAWQARADASRDSRLKLDFYGDLVTLLMYTDRPTQALQAATAHLELARSIRNTAAEVVSLLNLFSLYARRGDTLPALQVATEAENLLDDPVHARLLWAWNRTHLGIVLCCLGRYEAGLTKLESARGEFAAQNNTQLLVMNQNWTAEVLLLLGQPARAYALTRELKTLPLKAHVVRLLTQARVERAMGRDDEPLLRQAATVAASSGTQHTSINAGIALLRCEVDAQQALSAAASLQQRAQELAYFPLAVQAAEHRLRLLLALGRHDELTGLLTWLEATARAHPFLPVYLPACLLAMSEAYRALGMERDAQRCLEDAGRWILEQALPNVPAEMRDGFLTRNDDNRQVLAALTRRRRDAGHHEVAALDTGSGMAGR
ncbi:transcriptional regulator [Rubrivivax gelatinosus]|nr:transcriptional regulator [Rubrivivax gelatinosus]